MKIGIYGGSFDPPHKGHRLLAENLMEACGVHKVMVIPTAMSPFKETSGADAEDRLQMCKLAFPEERFEVSDIEISRGGKSYTVDTVSVVNGMYPDAELYLFMGEDMLLSFDRWYRYRDILSMCTLVAACRTEDLGKLQEMKAFAADVLADKVIICESVPVEISSTQVRSALLHGDSEYVSDRVMKYIKSRGLYRE